MAELDIEEKEYSCEHIFMCSQLKNLYFCKLCGVLNYDKEAYAIKPSYLNYSYEIDQLEQFKQILNEENESYLSQNEKNDDYTNQRIQLLQILRELVEMYNIRKSVYFLAIKYMDYICISQSNLNFELVCYSCFLLAYKFYDNDPKLHPIKYIKYILSDNYTEETIKKSEILCLKILSYNLNRLTAYEVLEFFLKNGIIFSNECEIYIDINQIYSFSYQLLMCFVSDSRFLDFTYLQVACAIVVLTRQFFKFKQGWPSIFRNIYNIQSEDFMNCYFVIKTLYNKGEKVIQKEVEQSLHFTTFNTNSSSRKRCISENESNSNFFNANSKNNFNDTIYSVMSPTNFVNNDNYFPHSERFRTKNYYIIPQYCKSSNCLPHNKTKYESRSENALNSTIDDISYYNMPVLYKELSNTNTSYNKTKVNNTNQKKISCDNINFSYYNNTNKEISPFNLGFDSNNRIYNYYFVNFSFDKEYDYNNNNNIVNKILFQ